MTKKITTISLIVIIASLVLFFGTAFADDIELQTGSDVIITDDADENDTEVTEEENTPAEENEADTENGNIIINQDDEIVEDLASGSTITTDAEIETELDQDEMNIIRARIKAKMDLQAKRRTELQERKDTREANLQDRIDEGKEMRIGARIVLAKRIVLRLENIHERLSLLTQKINARAEQLESEEGDASATLSHLSSTQLELDAASLSITELDAKVKSWAKLSISSNKEDVNVSIEENQESFKKLVISARDSLRIVHKNIKDGVRILKTDIKESSKKTANVTLETTAEVDLEVTQ